jgi:hypothetical protein
MSDLHLSPDMSLPADAVTQTFAILAKRGMGKTYTASVMAEEMLKAKSQVIIVDPVGVWWGLRSSPDGKSEGLQIVIAGGDHGDIPIEPTNGEILADFVVDNGISIVLDLSAFRKMQQVRFMTDFAESLYRRNRTAVHLILDEADAFAPQRPMPGEQAMLGAIEDIVRRGRARGIGVTMITQRPAVLNKNILTQIEVLVCLRLTAPLDQKAVDEWVKTHAEENQRQEFMSSLPSLPVGTAWFWSPGWLNLFQKVKVRKRETLDSSSTPKIGQKKTAAKLATVDLEKLTEQLQGSISQAQENDPVKLKARIKELEQREPDIQMHQVEVLPGELRVMLHRAHSAAIKLVEATTDLLEYTSKFSDASDTVSQFNGMSIHGAAGLLPRPTDKEMLQPGPDNPYFKPIIPITVTIPEPISMAEVDAKLSKAARTILGVLAQFPDGRTRVQIAILSQYSKKSSSFSNALGELRSKGLISPAGQEPITITDDGKMIAEYEPLPKGQDLVRYWQGKLDRASSVFLGALYAAHPAALNYDELQERTGYSRTSSSFSNALGKLRSLELATKSNPVKASDIFFEGES